MIQRIFILGLIISRAFLAEAQQKSTNGWSLPTTDTIRVFTVFVEIDYDTLASKDFSPNGTDYWPVGELPTYADSIFDPEWSDSPKGKMTKYYRECSFGRFTVLGDYFPDIISVPYSVLMKGGQSSIYKAVANALNAKDTLITKHGLGIDRFDLWLNPGRKGSRKRHRDSSAFNGLDHIMILTRNYAKMGRASGMASGMSMGVIHGRRTNTFSIFSGGSKFPFDIMHHEFNHLLIGGNNFHSGGGNSAGFTSYFPFVQGGWGMMGAANSSLLTCSGWDRYWLGWKPLGNKYEISARDESGQELNGDLTREGGGGVYVLRDFVTRGDALRIKLPFLPKNEFQQWLWVENHTTKKMNGSPFDVFHYQNHDCIAGATPGLYMYVQIDANKREASNVYGNMKADMRRPVLADGNYDFQWEAEKARLKHCVNSLDYYPYFLDPDFQNPLTGNHTQEFPQYFTQKDSVLNKKTQRVPFTHKIGDTYERIAMMGNPRQAFRESVNKKIGIGTNPSTANMLSLVNSRRPTRGNKKDNRTIYLNGISVEILNTFPDGSIKVRVGFDDNEIIETRRWCAPEIVLSNHIPDRPDLEVSGRLILDIGQTMTRFDRPIWMDGKNYFTDPTHLRISNRAEMVVSGQLDIKNQSVLSVDSGGTFTVSKGAKIMLKSGGTIRFEKDSAFNGKGKIKIAKGCRVECADKAVYKMIRRRTCNKRRVVLVD